MEHFQNFDVNSKKINYLRNG